jgi:hypothetical protein
MRGLVPAEIAIVLVIAIIAWPDPIPTAIPLVVAGSIATWVRGRSWGDVIAANGLHAVVGLAAGVVGLALALIGGAPLVEALTQRAVAWSANAVVRGNPAMLGGVVIYAAIVAVCMELALRGWLVERALELMGSARSPGGGVFPVLCGGFAEAIVTPGDATMRIGAGLFGVGLGWMYVAANRNVLAPMLARVAFGVGVVVLEGLRVIG